MTIDPPPPNRRYFSRRKILFFWGIIFILFVIGFLIWLLFIRFIAYTDDAYVGGNQVFITPLKGGFVTAIHTDDTFLVEKGKLLIELDKTDALISLDQAKDNLAQVVRDVCQKVHQVFAYRAEIEVMKANLIKAAQDYKHRKDVIGANAVSLEDFEHAIAEFRSSYFSLKRVEALYEGALAIVQGTAITTHPLVLIAKEDFRNAWVQLYRCNIYSPVEGLAAQRKIQVGMWVEPGRPLLSVIPLDQMWVNANFKETQLRRMLIGQNVTLKSDLYGGGVTYQGRIVGLPGAAGNAFSLLPPQNLTGNWIKIVQRLPVRVELDPEQLRNYPLRIGLSMEARADLHSIDGCLVPTSPKGSPLYKTGIFEKEEIGDEKEVEKIISANIDPTLLNYKYKPIKLQPISLSYDLDLKELEEVLLKDCEEKN